MKSMALFAFAGLMVFGQADRATAQTGAAEPSVWGSVGAWEITYFPANRGCYAEATFELGVQFWIGTDGTGEIPLLHLSMFNSQWASIRTGAIYSVNVVFGDETPWTLDMNGVRDGDHAGLEIGIPIDSPESLTLIEEIMTEPQMAWTYNSIGMGSLSLADVGSAFTEVLNCSEAYMNVVNAAADPFSAGARPAIDPFR